MSSEPTPLIEFVDVTKRFEGRPVLDRINLRIYENEVTTIIGKSGAGKSVLLKHIIGLLRPDSGSVYFRGKNILKISRSERSEILGKMSYMFQNNALFDSLNIYDNIAFPLAQKTRLDPGTIRDRVRRLMTIADLGDVAHKYPSELSGGMQKRVALCRALVTDPTIVLFDEPTTGQDIIRRNAILSTITQYQRKFGFTAVIISHDIPDVLYISNRVLILHQGKIIFQGSPEDMEGFTHPFFDEFVESLEGFQESLTGLHSRRSFKLRYQNTLQRKHPEERFAVLAFSVPGFDTICEKIGHETGQRLIQEIGAYISKHFDTVGGFSSRQGQNDFITVLPFTDAGEAQQLLDDFARDLDKNGLASIHSGLSKPMDCFEVTVCAGLAQGVSDGSAELFDLFRQARDHQRVVAAITCA